jgi:hypothetical protein
MPAYPFCRSHGQGGFYKVLGLLFSEALIFYVPEEKAIERL